MEQQYNKAWTVKVSFEDTQNTSLEAVHVT